MVRYDLRNLKDDFYGRMGEVMDDMKSGEVSIFMFEIGDFSSVQKSADLAKEKECELMNSLKFNEVDWTLVVKRK
jgi:NADH-quinone oxidoreductase subunit E